MATLIDPPRCRQAEIQPLTPDQARTLLAATKGHRLGALVSVALACGLRQGEIIALRWRDVDLEDGLVSVRHTLAARGESRSY